MAAISFVVQVGAVSVNYVNYEILLRSLYPTNWEDPLRIWPARAGSDRLAEQPRGRPVQAHCPGLARNSDLAWLWADGTTLWLVVLIGGAAVLTLGGALVLWWRIADQPDDVIAKARASGVVGAPSIALVVLAPMLVIATWAGEVGREPPTARRRAAIAPA
jgi:hypothetical protein